MRNSILIGVLAAMLVPTAANADPHGHGKAKQHHRAEVRHDARQAVRHAVRHDDRRHQRNWVAYSAPYRGWAYRPLRVGYQLRPAFYGSRYAITDYGAYRVAAPRRDHRWIRYGDDLLLVNIRTGRVLQVVPGRYW